MGGVYVYETGASDPTRVQKTINGVELIECDIVMFTFHTFFPLMF